VGAHRRPAAGLSSHVGANGANARLFICTVLYRCRAGIPRRDLPARFGDFRNLWLTGGQKSDPEGADAPLAASAGRTPMADNGWDAHHRVVAPALAAGKAAVLPSIRDGRLGMA
jgi:hypothetical protein